MPASSAETEKVNGEPAVALAGAVTEKCVAAPTVMTTGVAAVPLEVPLLLPSPLYVATQ